MRISKERLALQRQKYRAEFIKRNGEFQKLKQEIISAVAHIRFSGSFKPFSGQLISFLHKDIIFEDFDLWGKISELGERLFCFTKGSVQDKVPDQMEDEEDRDDPEERTANIGLAMIIEFAWMKNKVTLEEIVAREGLLSQSGMELVLTEGNEILGSQPIDHFERRAFQTFRKSLGRPRGERKENLRWLLKIGNILALDGVDKNDKTILVKIRLDQKRQDIEEDLKFLLDLLEWEAKELNIDLSIPAPKKNRFDIYDRCLQVYDLKKDNLSMEWSDIAMEVFPEDRKERKPPHRRARKNKLPSETEISKVRHDWVEANKMINESEWRQI